MQTAFEMKKGFKGRVDRVNKTKQLKSTKGRDQSVNSHGMNGRPNRGKKRGPNTRPSASGSGGTGRLSHSRGDKFPKKAKHTDFNDDDDDDEEEMDFSDEDMEQRNSESSDDNKMQEGGTSSDSDISGSSSDEDDRHKLPVKLEEMSDSEDEGEGPSKTSKRDKRTLVTMKMVSKWTSGLGKASVHDLREAVQAFRAAVQRAGSENVERSKYRVESGTVFNAVIRMCITEIPQMLNQLLKLPKKSDSKKVKLPSNSPQWSLVKKIMTAYLTDLIELLAQLTEASVLNVILRHVSEMDTCYASFPKIAKVLMRKLIKLWSSGEESSRVLAFLAINRLIRLKPYAFLEFAIKQMYMAYVKNCKFTSPTTLPLINFMQRSLVEVFAIDHEKTYQYAFMYIRQLAIHLRNAITVKKADTCQSVYNWQFIHSIHLWARTMSQLYPSDTLEPLIYPLVQTTVGTIKLIPTERYYPLRFHCIKALNMLSASTRTFIPVLPFLVEILELTNFNKKHKSLSMKPLTFPCILKLSKAQIHEKSFRDGVMDQMYENFMDALFAHAHTIGFPELVLPAIVQMKKFVKQCKVPNYTKQIKQIVDKVEETSRVITHRRKTATLNLTDNRAVIAWEARSKEEGTPLGKYYATWRKLRDRELQHEAAGKDKISGDDMPKMEKKVKKPKTATEEEREEFSELFQSDNDDSEDADSDVQGDFTKEELEMLARSGSEDEEEDEDEDEDDEDESEDGGGTESDGDISDTTDSEASQSDSDDSNQDDIVEDFELSSEDED